MNLISVALVFLGIVALTYGGIGYMVSDAGGIRATVAQNKTMPIAFVTGVITLVVAISLLMARRRDVQSPWFRS